MEATFLHKQKNAFLITFVIFILAICIIFFSQGSSNLLIIGGLILLCLPYIIPFIVLGGVSNKAKYLDPLWIKVIFFLIFTIYIALSASWSSSIVNETFYVSASNFPITTALINIAYFPYNFFGVYLNYSLLIFITLSPVLMIFFAFIKGKNGIKESLKIFIYIVFFSIYIGVSMSSVTFMSKNKDSIIKSLAVKLDFDSKNNCSGFNSSNYKVVHIGNGKIVVFNTNESVDAIEQFKIHDCKNL